MKQNYRETLTLAEVDDRYIDEIASYRQDFIDCGDHMDGCGSLRKYENISEYIENCRQRMADDAPAEIGGHAQQFLCINKTDNQLIGMIQYRYEADPKLQIGYSIRPRDRGNGYAKWMLRQLLSWLQKQGKTAVQIACEPTNLASEHVILSCGGELIETCNYKGIDLKVWNIELKTSDHTVSENVTICIETRDLIMKKAEFDEKNEPYALTVYLKTENGPLAIGWASMREAEPGIYEDMGIALGPEYTGKGYGKQILNALSEEAQRQGATEFRCSYREKNIASQCLQKVCRFEYNHKSEEKPDP